jgi:hypothetical protein
MIIVALPQIAASDIHYEYIAYGLAIFVGIITGLLGAGGSILTLPILVYVAGLEPKKATTYSLLIVGVTSLFSVVNYWRKNLLHLKTATLFFLPSILGVYLMRTFVLPHIPDEIYEFESFILDKNMFILLLFSVVMIIAAFSMIKSKKQEPDEITDMRNLKFNHKAILTQGFLAGSITGLVGAGGGFVIVPALSMFTNLPFRFTIGTSLLIIAINTLSGFGFDLIEHVSWKIDWNFAAMFLLSAMIGAMIGIFLNGYIKAAQLKKIFGYFVLFVGLYMLCRQIFGIIIT